VFEEQLENQRVNFEPPHPQDAMVSEKVLRMEERGMKEQLVNGTAADEIVVKTP
jgi:hypothetical protein